MIVDILVWIVYFFMLELLVSCWLVDCIVVDLMVIVFEVVMMELLIGKIDEDIVVLC